ncbi:MAG: nitroreductase family protein [Bacteroidales bacterium]|jgi:nitroreductase
MINRILKDRWSPYSFSPLEVGEGDLKTLFESAGLAPSGFNEQPWLFVYATRDDKMVFDSFLGFLNDSNRIWAQNAWALAISIARLNSSYNGKPNRFALYETGMAVGNMLAQATYMGLYIHQMGGFSKESAREYLKIAEGIEPIAMMAVGHKGNGENIPAEIYKKDEIRRPRKHVSEYTFRNSLPPEFIRS